MGESHSLLWFIGWGVLGLFGLALLLYIWEKRSLAIAQRARMGSQHYYFAHVVLPDWCWRRPDEFFRLLNTPQRLYGFQLLWRQAGQLIPPQRRTAPTGLDCTVRTTTEYTIFIVTLPPPTNIVEAYFVALVFGPFTSPPRLIERTSVHCFTLELTLNQATFFCERSVQMHSNFGPGPPAELEAFFTHVCAHLDVSLPNV